MVYESPETEKQEAINTTLRRLVDKKSHIMDFCQKQWIVLTDFCNQCDRLSAPVHKFTELDRLFHQHVQSTSYATACASLFGVHEINHAIGKICGILMFALKENIRKYKAETTTKPMHPTEEKSLTSISDTGKGVLRYIAGRCIHVLHRHLTQRVKKCLYSERKRAIVRELDAEICLVESLKVPYNELVLKTSQPETLIETERRQYLSHELR